MSIPKQFIKIAGKTIIEHTVDIFENHELIDEICIVAHPDWIWRIEEIVNHGNYGKVKKIISGGKERKDSSLSAIRSYELEGEEINLVFHDAVRPFLEKRVIDECIDKLSEYNAIDVAIPATDTIIEVEDDIIKNIPDRSRMMQGQTPQCFRLSTISKAYSEAMNDRDFKPTDDCGVVKRYLTNEKIYVVRGSVRNIKITYAGDIFLAEKLFQLKTVEFYKRYASGDYQRYFKDKVFAIFGAAYGIGYEIARLAEEYGAKVYGFSRTLTHTDVSSSDDVKGALQSVWQEAGRIDFVINTASILIKESMNHTEYSDMERLIATNYIGAVNIAKESYPYLKKSRGHLLNFTSSSYTRGRANYALYSSTKAAIVNLTQALSEEWMNSGIRVNCINPERTATPMRIKNFGIEDPETLLDAEEVAYVSLNTLMSDVSGQIVDVKKR